MDAGNTDAATGTGGAAMNTDVRSGEVVKAVSVIERLALGRCHIVLSGPSTDMLSANGKLSASRAHRDGEVEYSLTFTTDAQFTTEDHVVALRGLQEQGVL